MLGKSSKETFQCTNLHSVSVLNKRVITSKGALSAPAIGIVGPSTSLFGSEPLPVSSKTREKNTEDYTENKTSFLNIRDVRQPAPRFSGKRKIGSFPSNLRVKPT